MTISIGSCIALKNISDRFIRISDKIIFDAFPVQVYKPDSVSCRSRTIAIALDRTITRRFHAALHHTDSHGSDALRYLIGISPCNDTALHSGKDLAVSLRTSLPGSPGYRIRAARSLRIKTVSVRTSRLAASGNYPVPAAFFLSLRKGKRRVSGLSSPRL